MRLSVQVTKPLPRSDADLNRIIERFKEAGFTFGLYEDMPGLYSLWRAPLEDDSMSVYANKTAYKDVITANHPDSDEFRYLWEGKTLLRGLGSDLLNQHG